MTFDLLSMNNVLLFIFKLGCIHCVFIDNEDNFGFILKAILKQGFILTINYTIV